MAAVKTLVLILGDITSVAMSTFYKQCMDYTAAAKESVANFRGSFQENEAVEGATVRVIIIFDLILSRFIKERCAREDSPVVLREPQQRRPLCEVG